MLMFVQAVRRRCRGETPFRRVNELSFNIPSATSVRFSSSVSITAVPLAAFFGCTEINVETAVFAGALRITAAVVAPVVLVGQVPGSRLMVRPGDGVLARVDDELDDEVVLDGERMLLLLRCFLFGFLIEPPVVSVAPAVLLAGNTSECVPQISLSLPELEPGGVGGRPSVFGDRHC